MRPLPILRHNKGPFQKIHLTPALNRFKRDSTGCCFSYETAELGFLTILPAMDRRIDMSTGVNSVVSKRLVWTGKQVSRLAKGAAVLALGLVIGLVLAPSASAQLYTG